MELQASIPRVMLVAPGSGSGKTTFTCALLRALQQAGHNPAAFKCGPDYIDPMFHSRVLGVDSCNLDIFLCGEAAVPLLLAQNGQGHGLAVIEGVMGLYDGQGASECGSSNHVAILTKTPALLVLSPQGQSLSLAAQVSGFLHFAPNTIKGVLLNRCSEKIYSFYSEMLEDRLGLKVYGHLPPLPEAAFASRHLGLVTPAEIQDMQEKVDCLARACLAGVDLEGVVALARSAPLLEFAPQEEFCRRGSSGENIPLKSIHAEGKEPPTRTTKGQGVRIAVAQDRAFCFYYKDNFKVLQSLGANLVFFSPLEDKGLPEGVSGLILGGGYPEEYAAVLESNTPMRQHIRQKAAEGMPVFAECGGFLYLCNSLAGTDGTAHAMTGFFAADARMTSQLGPFGYVTLTAEKDTFIGPKGMQLLAHEFHYSTTGDNGNAFTARKAGGKSWACVHASGPEERLRIFAGFPHFHFRGNRELAVAFIRACRQFREKEQWLRR